jgi:hypothetical protein
MVGELFNGVCRPENSDTRERLEGVTGAEYAELRLNPLRHRRPPDSGANPGLAGLLAFGLDRAVRNGRDIVVTKIDCFSKALSDTPDGKKFRMESNGRWYMSAGGRGTPEDFILRDDIVLWRRLAVNFSGGARRSLESCGGLDDLSDANRNTLGGGNEAAPEVMSISASNDSWTP